MRFTIDRIVSTSFEGEEEVDALVSICRVSFVLYEGEGRLARIDIDAELFRGLSRKCCESCLAVFDMSGWEREPAVFIAGVRAPEEQRARSISEHEMNGERKPRATGSYSQRKTPDVRPSLRSPERSSARRDAHTTTGTKSRFPTSMTR